MVDGLNYNVFLPYINIIVGILRILYINLLRYGFNALHRTFL